MRIQDGPFQVFITEHSNGDWNTYFYTWNEEAQLPLPLEMYFTVDNKMDAVIAAVESLEMLNESVPPALEDK